MNEEAKQYDQKYVDDLLRVVDEYTKAVQKLAKEAIRLFEVIFKGADPEDEERNLSVGRESFPLSHWQHVPMLEVKQAQPFLDLFSGHLENTFDDFFHKNRMKLRTNTGARSLEKRKHFNYSEGKPEQAEDAHVARRTYSETEIAHESYSRLHATREISQDMPQGRPSKHASPSHVQLRTKRPRDIIEEHDEMPETRVVESHSCTPHSQHSCRAGKVGFFQAKSLMENALQNEQQVRLSDVTKAPRGEERKSITLRHEEIEIALDNASQRSGEDPFKKSYLKRRDEEDDSFARDHGEKEDVERPEAEQPIPSLSPVLGRRSRKGTQRNHRTAASDIGN